MKSGIPKTKKFCPTCRKESTFKFDYTLGHSVCIGCGK